MPTFCRHNHLIQNCPICSREQEIELRPIVSSSAPRSSLPRTPSSSTSSSSRGSRSRGGAASTGAGVRVRRLERGDDDGFHSGLAPGLRSSVDAQRFAEEIAFAQTRLQVLASDPPGLYAEVADAGVELEERLWLAFLIAYFCPLEGADPFPARNRELCALEIHAEKVRESRQMGWVPQAFRGWWPCRDRDRH